MEVVYAREGIPQTVKKSLFLVGPTPRSKDTPSWRPAMLRYLEALRFDGTVYVPEPRDGEWRCGDYEDQVEWEKACLTQADVILAWIPRELQSMPAFTTNVEFGTWIDSGKMVYGRPDNAPKNTYLDWLYRDRGLGEPYNDMAELAKACVDLLGEGSTRTGGERGVPLHIWKSKSFQKWYEALKAAGNRLDDAKLLWQFKVKGKFLFCHVLWAKVWIASEGRHKENEFVFTRTDISTIIPIWRHPASPLDSKIVLVKEYRVPSRTTDGFIHELPGGSSFKEGEDPLVVAAHELEEEVGIRVSPDRFAHLTGRQLVGTLSSHRAELFYVELTDEEIARVEAEAVKNTTYGVVEDTERTYVEVVYISDLLKQQDVDWSMMGMIFQGLASYNRRSADSDPSQDGL